VINQTIDEESRMTLYQCTTSRVALVLLWLCASVEAGGRLHHGPVCNGLEVPCAPKRPTYGYTPTTWRRWPSIQISAAPTRAAEELPTPAKDGRPNVEPDEPIVAPEEPPLVPSEPDSTLPPPSAEPIAPPFEDTPPSPPTEAEPKQTPPADSPPAEAAPTDATPPLDNLFDPPSTEPAAGAAPGAEVGPPVMPAEDPFKDDPFKDDPSPSAPAEDPPKGGTYEQRGAPALLGRGGANRWNSAARETDVASEGPELNPYARPGELRRLPESPRNAGRPEVLPASVSEKRNPLRATPSKARARTVVPTAGWSEERPAAQVSSAVRPNPLRPN
jgi:hypothetical protein